MLSITVTGMGTSPAAEMAERILNAVGEFSVNGKPAHLRIVRIAVFHSNMVDDFARAVEKKIEEKKTRGILGRMRGAT